MPILHKALLQSPAVRTYVTSPIRPGMLGCAAIAGTKLSKPVPGTRLSGVQVLPSVDVLRTIVSPSQLRRKTQSAQATYMRPDASTVAVASPGARRSGCLARAIGEMPVAGENVAPPSVDRTAYIQASWALKTMVPAP